MAVDRSGSWPLDRAKGENPLFLYNDSPPLITNCNRIARIPFCLFGPPAIVVIGAPTTDPDPGSPHHGLDSITSDGHNRIHVRVGQSLSWVISNSISWRKR